MVEPVVPPVPQSLDQTALEAGCSAADLAVANQVRRIWTAWLTTSENVLNDGPTCPAA